jgi:hypothetical protein
MRSGSAVTHVPPGEVDDEDLPSVAAQPATRLSSALSTPPTRARSSARVWVAVAVLTLLAGGAGLAVGARRAVLATPIAAATQADGGDSRSPTVTLHIETRPDGAMAKVAGVDRGTTPLDLPVAYGTTPISLELSRAGFAPLVQTVVPDEDQRLVLALAPEPPSTPSARPGPTARAPARPPVVAPPPVAPTPAPPPQPSARFRKFE